ncbi:MAG: chorismate mutase [Peptostreptococcaceae bacterium]|nr:chorismate mutase [Peptostreptococcaceae bacterium]
MNINSYRKEIDIIDKEIVKLFEQRLDIVEKILEYKVEKNLDVKDEDREIIVLENAVKNSKSEYKSYCKDLMKYIMDLSKKYQFLKKGLNDD